MSELKEIKALLCKCGLSERQLLREIMDAVTNDGNMERCSRCHGGCINCEVDAIPVLQGDAAATIDRNTKLIT